MAEGTGPTVRALMTLELLSTHPGLTADRLGERLGVSERAARRYVAMLRDAGIPVESVRGPYGGYRLGRGLRLPPLVFTAGEALGLVMAVLDGHHAAGDPQDPVGSAVGKIMRSLPTAVAAQAEAVRRGAAPVPDRSAARPEPETLSRLVQAASESRCIRLRYRSEAGNEWEPEVDPWAVVVRHGRWYLLCHSRSAAAVRAYRVDRIREATLLEETFPPPQDLDPIAALEEHLASGWDFDVDVLVHAPLAEVGQYLPRTLGRLTEEGAEATRLRASTSNPAWYAQQLAILPARIEVLGGPELRSAVRTIGQRLLHGAGERESPGSAG